MNEYISLARIRIRAFSGTSKRENEDPDGIILPIIFICAN